MPKKSPRIDAFVDESIRGQTYYLCAVLVSLEQQGMLRAELRRISDQIRRRRIHFHNESNKNKDLVLTRIGTYVSGAVVIRTRITHGVSEESARQIAMTKLVQTLQLKKCQRLIIEGRSDNSLDSSNIQRARLSGPSIDFVHVLPLEEEILWAADAIVWSVGSGSAWIQKLNSMSLEIINQP